MAKKSGISFSSLLFLQLFLGVFFLMLGIMGLGDYNSKYSEFARFFGRDDTMRVVMSVVELVMGVILILGLFMSVSADLTKIFSFALFGLWALYIVISFFLNNSFLEPNTVVWLYNISWHAVILIGLWVVGRRYM
jgi:uncharacterized membrane protein YphA (DoxX/SURF4 family)